MKNRVFFKVMWLVLSAGLLVSCMGLEDSDPSSLSVPEVKTFTVEDNGSLVFELKATVDRSATGRIASCGFYYSKNKDMSDSERIECKMTGNTFAADVTLREYDATYYACSYISNGSGQSEICSDSKKMTVKSLDNYVSFEAPVVESYDRESRTAVVSVSFSTLTGVEVTRCGLCYGVSSHLSVSSRHSDDTDPTDMTIKAEIRDIESGKACYIRPYVYDGQILAYGEAEQIYVYSVPVVETSSVTDITDWSAVLGGKISDDGGAEILACGVVWSTEPNPTLDLTTKTNENGEDNSFSSDITGLLPGTKYYVRAYASNSVGTSYGNEHSFNTDGEPLEIMPAANCFIVSKPGTYAFRTVKGNSMESVGKAESVSVLWESLGTSTTPSEGDLVKSVSCRGSYITFCTADIFREGNAVIAAKDASGKILWSWHIWLTDEPGTCSYYNIDELMMDRNLGATSATPGDVGALGLLYQWGRKDPFLGSSSISSAVEAKSTITWPETVSSSSSRGTIAYAVEHPTTFISYNSSNNDWYYTGSSTTDNSRWQSDKTIYDPCPSGWRVPDGGSSGVWAKAMGSSSSFDYSYSGTNEGMNFSGKFGSASTIWYPASGYRSGSDGSLSNVGNYGIYWSVTPNGYGAYYLYFYYDGYVSPAYNYTRAYGQAVRCLQE